MILSTFDLYWILESHKHWINIFYELFFDGQKLKYKSKKEYFLDTKNLVDILNKSDYRACHNFFKHDGIKLPLLDSHFEKNIDTLLIDSLLDFDKPEHHLNKSENNTPLEDANSTFKILEKNLIIFHKLDVKIQNILYSLLINYDEYNDFFIFYNKLVNNKLVTLNKEQIKENVNDLLIKKWVFENNFNFDIFFKNNNSKLALAYIILFLEKQKIVLPDFIYENNLELKKILRDNLKNFYEIFQSYFLDNLKWFLKEFYNFEDFTGQIQKNWVKYSLENKNLLTILSTWWWKSLIYQLPARIIWEKLWHLSLVITPLKALIKDQIDSLNEKWFNEVNYFSWDQNNLEKEIIRNKIKSWETKLLFITPEWLRNKSNLELLRNRFISRIIVDEAHTLILWWWEFRPDYFFIKTFLEDLEKVNLNKNINLTLLTATAPVDVEQSLKNYFYNKKFEIIKQENILKENIKPSVIIIKEKQNKIETLIQTVKQINPAKNPTIIFAGKRKTAEELVKHLKELWEKAEFFHAWMYLKDKKRIQEEFINWEINLIVATKAFWMWIDKENVRYVIHYDLPWNIEDYLQEIWRAWRDRNQSYNIIFYDKKEVEKRLKQLNLSEIYNFNILYFIKNVNINKEKKAILSPRQIAIFSWVKIEKNYTIKIKLLLNFLEREKIFKNSNVLKRKYDNTLVLLNKIEKIELVKNYEIIEKNTYLNGEEKNIAKEILSKIIDKKEALDLNNLEENFDDKLGKNFNFKNISLNKVINTIKSLKILWKTKNNETDLVLEAWYLINSWKYFWEKEDKFQKIFNIIWVNVKNWFENKNNFYESLKNYFLFKNFIKEKNWKIIIKNKNLSQIYKRYSIIGKNILEIFFDKNEKIKNNQIFNVDDLLKKLQKKYDIWIIELKEILFFLHSLNIIKIKNWLLILLTRYSLKFEDEIFELKEKLNSKDFEKKFNLEIKQKLDKFIEIKKQKLLALQLLIENLEKKWKEEYSNLAKFYFNHPLKEFSEKFLEKNTEDKEYEEYLYK